MDEKQNDDIDNNRVLYSLLQHNISIIHTRNIYYLEMSIWRPISSRLRMLAVLRMLLAGITHILDMAAGCQV